MDKKFFFQVVGLFIVIVLGITFSANPGFFNSFGLPIQGVFQEPASKQKIARIIDPLNSEIKAEFLIEVANTPEKRQKGLGGRESLAPNTGMFFEFPNLFKPRFWMKGMNFSIDIIWIRDNEIVDILENVSPPPSEEKDSPKELYEPQVEINKVLEVNAGDVSKMGIKVGDKIEYVN